MLFRKKKKLCIIGSAPSKADAPYQDESFDIWAISGAIFSESLSGAAKPDTETNSWNSVHRVDVFFEMHKRDKFIAKLVQLALTKKPIIMQKHESDIPMSDPFPADEIAVKLGEDYSSSIAYMLAYAIYLEYTEIHMYGIILMHETEYIRQRPGVKYYLGVARAKGIKVWAPENTQLTCSRWRYGYDDHDDICGQILARKKSLEEDMKRQEQVITDARAGYFQLRGAAIECDELITEIKGGLA